jgi:dTDP-glucose 4,6-dehydratase
MSKTILLTGGAGFIAHHFIEETLNKTDYNIVTLDRIDFGGNLNRMVDILKNNSERKRVRTVWHDLKSPINSQISSHIGKIDYIIHMAAGSHVDRSIEYPMEFVMDNVVGTVNLLDFAKGIDNLERFIYFSTDEVFGPAPNGIKFKEWDRYNSGNPYSASKAGAEEMVVAYENTYKIPTYITHTMNVFGERQHPEKYIPMCIRKVRDDEHITVHSNPEKTVAGSRHYIHAKDVAEGVHFLMNAKVDVNDRTNDAVGVGKNFKFNLVGPEEIDNLTLASIIANVQNKKLKYEMVDFHSQRPGHDLRYALDGSLMQKLGWQPKIKFTDRVSEVVDWSLKNPVWLEI